MEKWKIAVIALLLGGLVGYGFMQQNSDARGTGAANGASQTPNAATVAAVNDGPALSPKGETATAPVPGMKVRVPSWNVSKDQWANAPQSITPASIQGKPALIEFWRSGCSHCRDAAPHLTKIHQTYGPRGLQIVTFHSPSSDPDGSNPEQNWTEVKKVIAELGITYPVAFDKGGKIMSQVFSKSDERRYPTLMLVDPTGTVRLAQTGHTPAKAAVLDKALEELMK